MPEAETPLPPNRPDPRRWLQDHGDALFAYAQRRLADSHESEDVVQETLMDALRGYEAFEGRSSERTWLISIARHKVIDRIRLAARRRSTQETQAIEEIAEAQFTHKGFWQDQPKAWGRNPAGALELDEFQDVLRYCMSQLPRSLLGAFSLRELDGVESEEICKILNITQTNLWTLLHRARARLRACLELRWFRREP